MQSDYDRRQVLTAYIDRFGVEPAVRERVLRRGARRSSRTTTAAEVAGRALAKKGRRSGRGDAGTPVVLAARWRHADARTTTVAAKCLLDLSLQVRRHAPRAAASVRVGRRSASGRLQPTRTGVPRAHW